MDGIRAVRTRSGDAKIHDQGWLQDMPGWEGCKTMNSREKGKRGERELASELREHGYGDSRRGQQYCGSDGSADVVGLPGIHIECKRVERLQLEDAMSQSIADARDGELPVVMHRRNHSAWLVTMRLDDWVGIYREWEAGRSGEV